ncbi:hypothetical protein NUW54_g6971 [Trametes sanguinea]|uniref:Uncharacterized protein n=1 Tax=Trametes sanguinea TaxID=158606 RepID=A0ACC1PQE5_9APHY|nr:hypothetical protein NUW54_g6971 [Trametes sanguinea]
MASQGALQSIAAETSIVTEYYCATAALTLIAYYQLSTLDQALRRCTAQQFTGAQLLYLLNRLLPLLYTAYDAPFWPTSSQKSTTLSCAAALITNEILEALQYIPWAAFSALRMWALCRHKTWAIFVFFASMSPPCTSFAATHWLYFHDDPSLGCIALEPVPEGTSKICEVQCSGQIILADLAVLIVTWKTQYEDYKLAQGLKQEGTLITALLKNGTRYVVVLASLNTIQMAFEIHREFKASNNNASFLAIFSEVTTAILVDAFLNDLHNAAEANTWQEHLSSIGPLEFRVVGSIAATLPGSQENDDHEENTVDASPSAGDGDAVAWVRQDGWSEDVYEVPRAIPTSSSV